MYQKSGLPDLSILIDGVQIYLEVKVGKGKPSKLQLEIIEEIKEAGGKATIVWSLKEAAKFIHKCLKEDKLRREMSKLKLKKSDLVLKGNESFLERLDNLDLETSKKGDLTNLVKEIKEAYAEVDAAVRTAVLAPYTPLIEEIARRDKETQEQKEEQLKASYQCLNKYSKKFKFDKLGLEINKDVFVTKYKTKNKMTDDKREQATSAGVSEIKTQIKMLRKVGASKSQVKTYLNTLNLDDVTIVPQTTITLDDMTTSKRVALLDYLDKNGYDYKAEFGE